ncbi:hypothetical protein [Endozoicomonas sp. ONNA1]|uniref:hypothetical protein n=2 Tax=unclassified Endozoicomonas TaxID=2644528 RepID=UPI002147DE22|nr:hypothetical protein [Endozoicomonas sp. ONNA1]
MVLLFLLQLSFSTCQAQPLTRRFVVDFEQKAGSPDQIFSVKRDRQTLPDSPADITNKDGYEESDSSPDDKSVYGAKTTLIESNFWLWLYATHLLVGYGPILTTENLPSNSTPYSWLPAEVVVVLGWLLKNYWNSDLPSFNLIKQQEATSLLKQGNHLFATITMMLASGHSKPQNQPPGSSSQETSGATTRLTGSFISPLNTTDYDGGNGGSQQHSHTLGLNCFVHPCHDVCIFRPSSDSGEPADRPPNAGQSPCAHLANGYCFSCMSHFGSVIGTRQQQTAPLDIWQDIPAIERQYDFGQLFQSQPQQQQPHSIDAPPANNSDPGDELTLDSLRAETSFTTDAAGQSACDATVSGEDSQLCPCGRICNSAKALSVHKSKYHTGQQTCYLMVEREDGQQQPCGKVCKHAKALSDHKRIAHTGQKICDVMVVWEDGHQRPCGTLSKNLQALSTHKNRYHSGQRVCDVMVQREDGQQRLCGKICKNVQALRLHRGNGHSEQKNCDVTVVGEDGQPRPCGRVWGKHITLSNHKSGYHTGHKTCHVAVTGEDGQQRPCGKISKNAKALTTHKSRYHSGQRTCHETVVGEDGQRWLCCKVCKNNRALYDHKSRCHTGQQTCNETVVGADDQQRLCGKVCSSAKALMNHKRVHLKRKTVD